ncbi:MAG: hypothetical protein ACRC62_07095 [Microcoleus sp.]
MVIGNFQLSTINRSRAGTLALQLSTLSGGHGGTAPTDYQLSTINYQLSTIN